MKKVYISALSSYHPDGLILNKDFEKSLSTTDEWIRSRTGIVSRFTMKDYVGELPVVEIARRAVQRLEKSSLFDPKKIDLVISASTYDDLHYPSAGNLIAEEYGIIAPVFQLKSACTSVAYAIHVAKGMIGAGQCSSVLVVNGEPFTRFVDYGDRSSCILFGDAATAMLVTDAAGGFEVVDSSIGGVGLKLVQANAVSETSHLTAEDILAGELTPGKPPLNRRRSSDKKFQQDGKKVTEFVLKTVPVSVKKFLTKNKISTAEVDKVIFHQSNLVMMRQLLQALEIAESKHLFNVDTCGNTSSAGWVSVLSQKSDEIDPGDLILTSVFGAGMTWANLLLRKCT